MDNNQQDTSATPEELSEAQVIPPKNSTFVLLVILSALIGIIVLATVVWFWQSAEVEVSPQPEPEVPTISDDQLRAERDNLPITNRIITPVVIPEDAVIEGSTEARFIPEAELSALPAANNTEPAVPGTVTTGNDSSVQVKAVEVTNLAQTGTPETITRSGVVRMLDLENGSFVIGDPGSDPYQINVTPATRFWINGQRVNYEQLQRDDIVEVTGVGYTASVKLDADTVTIVGRYQRVDQPIN